MWRTNKSTLLARPSSVSPSVARAATTTSSTRSRLRDYYAMAGIFRSPIFTINRDRNAVAQIGTFSANAHWDHRGSRCRVGRVPTRNHKDSGRVQNTQSNGRGCLGGMDSKELDGIVLDNLEAEVVGSWAQSNYSTNLSTKIICTMAMRKEAKARNWFASSETASGRT